jgi:hypothetical protein
MEAEPFTDNWAYLRTELNWLDRLLSAAVARHRKEIKEVDRVAKSRIDRVSSHWWKGLITIDGEIAGDSPADYPRPAAGGNKISYQQQLDRRIQASQQKGLTLALPSLCQRLQLTPFEKNLLLMALAPEVSRRYSKIYNFLHDPEQPTHGSLPTVDLILRLLTRSDHEWRKARLLLTARSPLVRYRLVILPAAPTESLLVHPVKLQDAWVEYLLADHPTSDTLETLLTKMQVNREPVSAQSTTASAPLLQVQLHPQFANPDAWSRLILPQPLVTQLKHWCDELCYLAQLETAPAMTQPSTQGGEHPPLAQGRSPGILAFLIGASGTGKTTAGSIVSHTIGVPFHWVDLALLTTDQHNQLLQEILAQSPPVLFLKSAQRWFGRRAVLSTEAQERFWAWRRQHLGLTLLSVERKEQIRPVWQRRGLMLEFALPTLSQRQQLWQQAIAQQVAQSVHPISAPWIDQIDWSSLAQLPLNGGQIHSIVQDAIIGALAPSLSNLNEAASPAKLSNPAHPCSDLLTPEHLADAIAQHQLDPNRLILQPPPRSGSKAKSKAKSRAKSPIAGSAASPVASAANSDLLSTGLTDS